MAKFQRRSFGGGTANQQQWNINVKLAKYDDDGNFLVKLSGVKKEDVDKLSQIDKTVFLIKQNPTTYETMMKINGKKLDVFMSLKDKIEQTLTSTNNYTSSSISTFCEKIENFMSKVPNAEEEANVNSLIANNWKELLTKLEDENVRKKFLQFQTTYYCAEHYRDAMLSPKNIVSVLSADPMATFVTDAETWERRFKRYVKPNSPYVIISKVENIIPKIEYLEADPIVKSYGGWKKVLEVSGDMWHGIAYAAIKRVRQQKNLVKPDMFYKSKAYDVRYTVPMDPNNDPFMKIAGLINNMTGEVNDTAKATLKQEKGMTDDDLNKKREGNLNTDNLSEFKNFIVKKCKLIGITLPSIGNDEDIIINGVYQYAYKKAEMLNMLHDKTKTAFASAMVYAIAASYNLNTTKVKQCVDALKNFTPDELSNVAMNIFELYRTLASFKVSESIIKENHILSFEEFKDLIFSACKQKEDVKNDFMEMLNRINKPIKE